MICRHELREAIARQSEPDDEWEKLQAQAAASWRARNAEALRRFGLL